MKRHRTVARPLSDLLWLFVGPGVWFAHLAVVYGAEGLICLNPANSALMVWTVAGASLAAITALVAFTIAQVRTRSADTRTTDNGGAFLWGGSLLLALFSLIGVLWTTLPIVFLRACATH